MLITTPINSATNKKSSAFAELFILVFGRIISAPTDLSVKCKMETVVAAKEMWLYYKNNPTRFLACGTVKTAPYS